MMRRIGVMSAALALMAVGPTGAPEVAAADRTWCMTYCDAIHLGCKKTIGLFDAETCEHWKAGCLDGCRVNE
jgi:hypothetical protein